jgi:acetyltransferase-like isoleucine patch superfamily enzyme
MYYLSKFSKLIRKYFFKMHSAPNGSVVSILSNGLQNVNFGGENNIPEFCVFSGKCSLGFRTTLGKNNFIFGDVTIGKYCQIGAYVAFHSSNHPVNYLTTYINQRLFDGELAKLKTINPIVVGHDVWIGHGAVILSGVTVGSGAIIGAGSIVTKDVPPYSIVGGNPAKVIKYRFSEEIISELLAFNWWDLDPKSLKNIEALFFSDLTKVSSIYEIIKDK